MGGIERLISSLALLVQHFFLVVRVTSYRFPDKTTYGSNDHVQAYTYHPRVHYRRTGPGAQGHVNYYGPSSTLGHGYLRDWPEKVDTQISLPTVIAFYDCTYDQLEVIITRFTNYMFMMSSDNSLYY